MVDTLVKRGVPRETYWSLANIDYDALLNEVVDALAGDLTIFSILKDMEDKKDLGFMNHFRQ